MLEKQSYGDQFANWVENFFYKYGCFVGRNPKKILIATLIFTLICLPGLTMIKINLDLFKLFVPINAPVRFEFESQQAFQQISLGTLDNSKQTNTLTTIMPLIKEKLPVSARLNEVITSENVINLNLIQKNNSIKFKRNILLNNINAPIHNDILRYYVVHKNYENLLVSETLGKLYNYTNEFMNVIAQFKGKELRFEKFCKKPPNSFKCTNDLNIWLKHAENLFKSNGSRNNPNLQLSYPVMYLFNRPKDIGNIIYGVDIIGEKHEIVGARVLTIHWYVSFPLIENSMQEFMAFRQRLDAFWEEKTKISNIKFIPHNDKAMDDELRLIIETAVPFAIPAVLQLMVFLYFTNIAKDVRKSKPVEAFFGVICVCFGLLATFGITFYFGLPFNPVSSTMPFLILAVGVDDVFLMLGAWRTSDPCLSVEKRMGITMSDAGVSITVTSFTNFGCFTLGFFLSPTPAVGDFCLLTAIGIIFDYLYQITFFAAIMVLSGMNEKEGGIKYYFSFCNKKKKIINKNNFENEEQNVIASWDEPMFMHQFFKDIYAPFILRSEVKLISWLIFIIYVCISFYGCSNMRVDISPKKYIRDNSNIQTFVYLADKYIWADNVMPTFYVTQPPDFRNATQRARFNELVFKLENTKYSIGRVSTSLWVWEYQNYLNDFPKINYDLDFYNQFNLHNFFSQFDYHQLRNSVKFNDNVVNGEPNIIGFTFQTSFYGLDSWEKRQTELFHWRNILKEFSEFKTFLAGIFSPFLIDQRKTIAPSSMQSVGSAIAVMTLISMFFLPDKQSVFVMSFSLISISMGVCGFLCLWGSDLDSVSMGCIIMAIGLAVDFSIHICYRYHRCINAKTANEKVIETLSIVGFPILQAGCSTLWAMTTLPLIPAYLVRVFYQTVVLVNVIGLFHALLWLPQFISSLDPIERIPRRVKYPYNE